MNCEIEPLRVLPTPGPHPCGLAWDGSALWYSDGDTCRISRLDPETGAVWQEHQLDAAQHPVRTGLAYWEGMLYQVAGRPKSLVRIDPATGKAEVLRPLGEDVCGIDGRGPVLYLLRKRLGILEAQEWGSGVVLGTWPATATPGGLTLVGGQCVWADAESVAIRVWDGDGREASTAPQIVGGQPTGLAWGAGRLFVNDYENRQIRVFTWPERATPTFPAVDAGVIRLDARETVWTRAELAAALAPSLFHPTEADLDTLLGKYQAWPHALYGLPEAGRLIGVVGVDFRDAGLVEISHLAVEASRRGQGRGRKVVESVQRAVAPRVCWLTTDEDAVGFYRRLGFVVHSLGERYPGRERFLAVSSQ